MTRNDAFTMRFQGANWYERFLNRELTDEILRKDAPCGKKFSKVCENLVLRYFRRINSTRKDLRVRKNSKRDNVTKS